MPKVRAICKKCGKEFLANSGGQKYCQNPCKRDEYSAADGPVWPTERTRFDCRSIMDRGDGLYSCRALRKLYCNFEKCKFFKPK